MGCRCAERAEALRQAIAAGKQGQLLEAARKVASVGRTLVEDTRSGDLRRAAQQRITMIRGIRR